MTDFENPYYSAIANLNETMAAIHEGNITALGKDNIVTTNFTDQCVARDLTIVLNRETDPSEANLTADHNTTMQQYLKYGSGLDFKTTFDYNQTGEDANLTLAKAAFEDSQAQGSARVKIYTTFGKPRKEHMPGGTEGTNPIVANYLEVNASSPDANSTAHLAAHIPKGTQDFDQNITFIYGRIAPEKRLYIVKDKNGSIETPLYVYVYWDKGAVECREYDLNTTMTAEGINSGWYIPDSLFATPNTAYGNIDMNNHRFSGKITDVKLEENGDSIFSDDGGVEGILENRHFDGHAHLADLTVSMKDPARNNRPTTVTIGYYPPPWLLSEEDSKPTGTANIDADIPSEADGEHKGFYRVRFIPEPTAWTGYGKTGHVVGDKDSGDDINFIKTKRLEW
jgi:membrane-bound inhibitor of C-type lysozyme